MSFKAFSAPGDIYIACPRRESPFYNQAVLPNSYPNNAFVPSREAVCTTYMYLMVVFD